MSALARTLSALLLSSCCVGSNPLPASLDPVTDTTTCPTDERAAIGTPCGPDGRVCGASSGGFTHFIMCSRGTWVEMEAPPPPPPPAP